MPTNILPLTTDTTSVTKSNKERIAFYGVPSWAATELVEFMDWCAAPLFEETVRKGCVYCSSFLNAAHEAGCNSFADLEPKLKELFEAIPLSVMRLWDFRFLLWLTADGKIALNAALSAYISDKNLLSCMIDAELCGDAIVAQDLLDLFSQRTTKLPVPAWAYEEFDQFDRETPASEYIDVQKSSARLLLRWLHRHYKLTSCSGIKPLMLVGYREFEKRSHFKVYVQRRRLFIDWLCDKGILPPFMPWASKDDYKDKLQLARGELSKQEPGDCLCSAEELFALADSVCAVMKKLGYSQTLIKAAQAALTNHSLYLYELDRGFSLEHGLTWAGQQHVVCNKGSYAVALFIASKLLRGQEVTVDSLMEEHYSPRLKRAEPFPKWAAPLVGEFLKWETALGWSESTITCKRVSLKRFVEYLQTHGCTDFSTLKVDHIDGFVLWDHHETSGGKSCYNLKIRGFLAYLADRRVIPYKVAMAMPGCCGRSVRPVKILTPEQREEIRRFCAEAASEKDSRIKLALLLALRMGLRKVDITNLKLTDINLDTNELEFVQQKTKRRLRLPIPDEVLEGLCQYLLRTPRSDIESDRVMLSLRAPHQKIKELNVQDTFKNLDCGHFSLHDCRRTLASDMLAAGVNMWTIVATIGHSDLKTVHRYLTSETEMLRECCLPMGDFAMSEEVWS